jgi:hypothetical protein
MIENFIQHLLIREYKSSTGRNVMSDTGNQNMSIILTDEFVQRIINEPKYLVNNIDLRDLKGIEGQRKMEVNLECEKYPCKISIRQTIDRPTNFSVILRYIERNGISHIICRYNGYHGDHFNIRTKDVIRGPHIHRITEWYQRNTDRPDGHAEKTDKYADLAGAVKQFESDMNITIKRPSRVGRIEEW